MATTLNEIRFMRIYRELTGAGEGLARSAFMFACSQQDGDTADTEEEARHPVVDLQWTEERNHEPFT